MSVHEEPPSKVAKFEMESQFLEGEVMDEGQEEWLSEGVLTDDDYNPDTTEQDRSGNTSQDENATSLNEQDRDDTQDTNNGTNLGDESDSQSQDNIHQTVSQLVENMETENIEDTLNNFETQSNNQALPGDLDEYLIRKTVIKPAMEDTRKPEDDNDSDVDKSKDSDDNGNDTDDLLRMLGDGDNKAKAMSGQRKEDDGSSDDDEYIFQGPKLKTNAQLRQAARAVPEDDDVTDASSDECDTMKKMFGVTSSKPPLLIMQKPTATVAKPAVTVAKPAVTVAKPAVTDANPTETVAKPTYQLKSPVKHVVYVQNNPTQQTHKPVLKTYSHKRVPNPLPAGRVTRMNPTATRERVVKITPQIEPKSEQKMTRKVEPKMVPKVEPKWTPKVEKIEPKIQSKVQLKTAPKMTPKVQLKIEPKVEPKVEHKIAPKVELKIEPNMAPEVALKKSQKVALKESDIKPKPVLNSSFDNDDFGVKQPRLVESQDRHETKNPKLLRIMKPEEMDEEMPTDSESDEGESIYDELPSSGTESEDDWFTLDIRAERAGEYLPLLGNNALQLLTEEKERVTARLSSLKKELSTVTETGREQAAQLQRASVALAELDASLTTA